MKSKILLLTLTIFTFFSCKQEKKEIIPDKEYTEFIYELPDSKYVYNVKINEISTEIVKNAFTVKEDKYTIGTKKDGLKISLNISITNPYDKEMQNIPFPYSFCLTSPNQEFFSNETIRRKKIGDIIIPKITDEKNRKIKLTNSRDYVQDIVNLNFKAKETKQIKLQFDNAILNEVKSIVLVDFALKTNENDDNQGIYQINGLLIDLEKKRIIGEKTF